MKEHNIIKEISSLLPPDRIVIGIVGNMLFETLHWESKRIEKQLEGGKVVFSVLKKEKEAKNEEQQKNEKVAKKAEPTLIIAPPPQAAKKKEAAPSQKKISLPQPKIPLPQPIATMHPAILPDSKNESKDDGKVIVIRKRVRVELRKKFSVLDIKTYEKITIKRGAYWMKEISFNRVRWIAYKRKDDTWIGRPVVSWKCCTDGTYGRARQKEVKVKW